MIRLAEGAGDQYDDRLMQETRESLKRSSQQSLSAAVLVSLAHKRYERRRLAAMEIEKVVRSLVLSNKPESLERVRAILLLLSDDYVRSTSEDARKGGVVALAACAIGLKRASDSIPEVSECRDLILASVVHACQDHSQRVRYYATESLFNVVKVIPQMAVQHFFILFEILRSLYADVDVDVRSGAELLDKKLKEVIVGAINSGLFTAEECIPIFARFVYMRNKATKRLTLTWLQELNEKLIGSPVLDFLHLFLGGIFAMIADPNISIRQSALAFLQSVLPKLLMEQKDDMFEEAIPIKVDFDKLIQSLVTTLEHPDPFVRKVAIYWMSRIVKTHMGSAAKSKKVTPAGMSVRNSLPHLLPGILLR
jgi:vacuole morphology and inheritance protein 14